MPTPRAAIYARYSSENQRDESIDAQVRLCKGYIEKQGYILARLPYIDEALTGKNDQRPRFQQMLSDSKAGLFDVVVIDAIDRFSRNKVDSGWHKQYLRKKCNVRVEYASQRIDSSPEGQLLEGVLEDLAQFHSANLARETMKGLTENALKCWHTGGKPAFGFSLKEIPETKTPKHPLPSKRYVINESEAPVVRTIFTIYDAGGTYGDIQAATRDDMIRLHGRPLSKNSIHDILRNEKYSGVFVYRRGTTKEHRHTRDDAIRVPGIIPGIVPREMWGRVQARMDKRMNDNGECARGRAKEVYLLAGLITCAKCQGAMVGVSGYGRDKIRHAYYVCGKKQRSKECDLKTIRKDTVEQMAITAIKELFSPEGKEWLYKQFEVYLSERPQQLKEQTDYLKREIAGLNKKIANIVDAVAGGRSSSSLMDSLNQFEEQREVLRSQLLECEAKEQQPVSIDVVMLQLEQAEEKLNGNDLREIKKVCQTFIDIVEVDDEGVNVKLKIIPPSKGSEGGSYTSGSANESRTRASALRGRCPRPLDDSAIYGCGTRTRT
jgi:site-specific DNA recombinase